MKKIFSKLPLMALLAVMCGMFTGCDLFNKDNGKFSVSIKEVGASYVDLEFKGPEAVEIAFVLDTKEQLMNNFYFYVSEMIEKFGGSTTLLLLGIIFAVIG